MGSKISQMIVGAVVIIIIVVGVYAIMHKSATSKPSTTASTAGPVVQTLNSSTAGAYLATTKGQALYTYGHDSAGVSNCTGSCLTNWPAYVASGSVGSLPAPLATIKRADGSMQYTYNGMPLYTFTGDGQSGNVTGDGSEGFHVAKPTSSAAAETTPSTSPAATPAPAPAPAPAPQSAPSPAPSSYNY